ncbi:MAG: metal ABC transporter ATP-binding protein [Alistipes sp.]
MATLVSIRDVSVRYGNYTALEHVCLDIFDDDFIGIIGPNGGGKTTLVKSILGAIPYSGTITHAPSLYSNGKRLIGYMPQQSDFDRKFPISVVDVVMSGLQAEKGFLHGYTRRDKALAMELLEMADIADIADSQIGDISGGQLQRALLCRAVILSPKMLILDEPANFVDNRFENELYALLHRLNDKMAIVMVSHDIGTITSVVKNIVCVNRHVHRHDSNVITQEQLDNYQCPIQIVTHGTVPHTVLDIHE